MSLSPTPTLVTEPYPQTRRFRRERLRFFTDGARFISVVRLLNLAVERDARPPHMASRAAAESWLSSKVPENYRWPKYVNASREMVKQAAIEDGVEMLREAGRITFDCNRERSALDQAIGFRRARKYTKDQTREVERLRSAVEELEYALAKANSKIDNLTKLNKVTGWLWWPYRTAQRVVAVFSGPRRSRGKVGLNAGQNLCVRG